jgi:bifunctional N-acetylglucosamine-1-phosphate-uridyltransferase/glucosamine-1-phosphate-acetyltransferase GlmU-like protein
MDIALHLLESRIGDSLINEINTGIYCVKNKALHNYLKLLKNDNVQKEYYFI